VNNEEERERKEAAVLQFDVLFWYLPEGTEQIMRNVGG
jgi:hypothetical protein